jgi:endonuclease/exonuclease/phosphatase family metal-dependent hydrolase
MRHTGLGVLMAALLAVPLVMPADALTLGPSPRCGQAGSAIQVPQLAASGADVLGLQEVGESPRHGRVIERLAAGLATATSSRWYWCWFRTEPHVAAVPDLRPGGGDPLSDLLAQHYNSHETRWYQGAAVLSRWPIVAAAAHRLPGEDVARRLLRECVPALDPLCVLAVLLEPRAAVWARVATPLGRVSVIATHTSGTARQHADLARWAARRSSGDRSAFILCDCNSLESSTAHTALGDGGWIDTYRRLHGDRGATSDQDITALEPSVTTRIDYVWARAGSTLHAQSSQRFMNTPVAGLWPSDHWGVLTTVG